MVAGRSLTLRFILTLLVISIPVALFAAPAARMAGGGSYLEWQLSVSGHEKVTLTISAPDGEVYTREFAAGKAVVFSLKDLPSVADGSYTYQLSFTPRVSQAVKEQLEAARAAGDDSAARAIMRKAGLEPVSQTGGFAIANGAFVSPDAKENDRETPGLSTNAAREPGARKEPADASAPSRPGSPVVNDQVIPDDLIVQSSLCVGFDCVNNESFGFDTIRLKENSTRIKFEDTSTGSFPSNDWQLTANDSASGGANKFSVEDITGSKVPMTITAGAATNSIFVDSTGRLGLRTSTPVLDLHINTSNTPSIRLEQNNSGGFTAQTWDIAGNEANFFVRDVTGGSRLPFRIRPGAPTSSIDISADGDVGIGTASPARRLDVVNEGASDIGIMNTSGTDVRWFLQVDSDVNKTFKMSREGGGGPVVTMDARLDANGVTFKVDGSVQATNVVFSSSRALKNELASIDSKDIVTRLASLPISKWTFKNDAKATEHIGPMAEDFYKLFSVGTDAQHISVTDANGVALSAIKGLAQMLQERDEEMTALKARLAELEKQVKTSQQ
jgi:hypothetical protein